MSLLWIIGQTPLLLKDLLEESWLSKCHHCTAERLPGFSSAVTTTECHLPHFFAWNISAPSIKCTFTINPEFSSSYAAHEEQWTGHSSPLEKLVMSATPWKGLGKAWPYAVFSRSGSYCVVGLQSTGIDHLLETLQPVTSLLQKSALTMPSAFGKSSIP